MLSLISRLMLRQLPRMRYALDTLPKLTTGLLKVGLVNVFGAIRRTVARSVSG